MSPSRAQTQFHGVLAALVTRGLIINDDAAQILAQEHSGFVRELSRTILVHGAGSDQKAQTNSRLPSPGTCWTTIAYLAFAEAVAGSWSLRTGPDDSLLVPGSFTYCISSLELPVIK